MAKCMEVYGSEEVTSFTRILVRDSERLSGILANTDWCLQVWPMKSTIKFSSFFFINSYYLLWPYFRTAISRNGNLAKPLWAVLWDHTDSPWVTRLRLLPYLHLFALLCPATPSEGILRKRVVDMKNLFPAKSLKLHLSLKHSAQPLE